MFGQPAVPDGDAPFEALANCTEESLKKLKKDFMNQTLDKSMDLKLLWHFLQLCDAEDRQVVDPKMVQHYLNSPFNAPPLKRRGKLIFLPSVLHLDGAWSLVIVNINNQSVHVISHRYRLSPETTNLVSRIVAGLYTALNVKFHQGGSQVFQYKVEDAGVQVSSDLQMLHAASRLAIKGDLSVVVDYQTFKRRLNKSH